MNAPNGGRYSRISTGDPVLITYWEAWWRRRWLALSVWAVVLAAGIVFALITPATYQATTTLSVRDASGDPFGSQLSAVATTLTGIQIGGGASTSVRQAVAGLKSREITYRFIEEHNILPDLFPDRWNAATQEWRTDDGESLRPSLWEAYELFDREVRTTSVDYDANIVNLSIIHTDADKAATWANSLVDIYNEERRAQTLMEGERRVEYVLEKLKEVSVMDIRRPLIDFVQSQLRSNIVAAGVEDFEFEIIDRAVPPEEPSWPNQGLIIVVSALLGLLLGTLLALMWDGAVRLRSGYSAQGKLLQ